MYDVYVVSATTDAAGKVEFRDAAGGVSKVVTELTVPAYGFLDLTPQGTHAVLIDLRRPLAAGETVTISFTTDGGATFAVTAPVKAP